MQISENDNLHQFSMELSGNYLENDSLDISRSTKALETRDIELVMGQKPLRGTIWKI